MQPRSRSQRFQLLGKERLEKERLKGRTGGYFRYEHVNDPTEHAVGCPSHMHPKARMCAGPRCEEINFEERQNKIVHRDDITEFRRRAITTGRKPAGVPSVVRIRHATIESSECK